LEPHLYVFSSKKILVVDFLPRGGLPPGAEAGYVYDWIRQRQKREEENRRQRRKLKKKVKKLTKKRKKERRREPNKIVKAIKGVERRIEEEKKHLHRII
jgi:methyl coenzyme M reductase subunit C-like uncharacterized protein (methanogenesis marker protein 7)